MTQSLAGGPGGFSARDRREDGGLRCRGFSRRPLIRWSGERLVKSRTCLEGSLAGSSRLPRRSSMVSCNSNCSIIVVRLGNVWRVLGATRDAASQRCPRPSLLRRLRPLLARLSEHPLTGMRERLEFRVRRWGGRRCLSSTCACCAWPRFGECSASRWFQSVRPACGRAVSVPSRSRV